MSRADFKIHSICVLKNEADIIGHCLDQALSWSDHVILYDGQSTDGTWEIVQERARRDPRVIPWKQDGKVFQESLRAEVFNAYRHLAKPGDWWCHLDADEFYVTDPRAFLRQVHRPYDVVWGLMVEYYLTQQDVDTLDFQAPIEALLPRLKHYRAKHAEPRFFRHRDRLVWRPDRGWPDHMGLSWRRTIPFRHFKYRSPEQIQRRLDTRRSNVERGFPGWEHARTASWRDQIAAPNTTHMDEGQGRWQVDPQVQRLHLGSPVQRTVKYLLHGLGVWP